MSEEQVEQIEEEVVEDVSQDDVEDRARMMGWKDPDEFKGDPDKALSAEEFLRRGEEELPILKENLRRLQREMQEQRGDFDYILKMQAQNIKSKYDEKIREAVENGDVTEYERLNKAKNDDLKTIAPKREVDPAPYANAFMQSNDWFGKDEVKTAYAEKKDREIAELGLSPQEHFERLQEAIDKQFKVKKTAPPVEGGRPRGAPKSKTMRLSELDDDARMVAKRVMKRMGWSEDEYMKRYQGEV